MGTADLQVGVADNDGSDENEEAWCGTDDFMRSSLANNPTAIADQPSRGRPKRPNGKRVSRNEVFSARRESAGQRDQAGRVVVASEEGRNSELPD